MAETSSLTAVDMTASPIGNDHTAASPRTGQHVVGHTVFTSVETSIPVKKTLSNAAAGSKKDEAHRKDPVIGKYQAFSLTFIGPAPVSNTLASNIPRSTGPATTSPTRPAPVRQSYAIRQHPEFNLDELRSIFPSDLPPRPQPKRKLLPRMFRSRAGSNEDIEFGSPVSSPESFWAFMVKDWHFWLAALLWVVCIGLAGIVYQGVMGQGEMPMDGTDPMGDHGGSQQGL
ncbi:hypothetical protein BDU57DRAFT_540512 [Ampelomyces quisqualis]|uniref:Uncharacterized protein n=1 Tax=Ampelomyces quisqualis TaxID=50730 RepID=A0A6A5QKJ6_AMPQU|nr:hypothetical protein BDU57DRAFT_540512 [Ampelomyces quisqualis]